MATLPYSEWIISPVTWTGAKQEKTFRSGAGRMSVSLGLKPTIYSTTLQWVLPAAWVRDLKEQLEAADHDIAWDFDCRTAGPVRVYCVGAMNYTERQEGLWVRCFLPVEHYA